jgi:hypothetical protein
MPLLALDCRLILPPTCGYLLGRGDRPLPRRNAMSPIVIVVFAPVVVIGLVFYAVLLGAAAAGVWEAVEARAESRLSASGQSAPPAREYPRAA